MESFRKQGPGAGLLLCLCLTLRLRIGLMEELERSKDASWRSLVILEAELEVDSGQSSEDQNAGKKVHSKEQSWKASLGMRRAWDVNLKTCMLHNVMFFTNLNFCWMALGNSNNCILILLKVYTVYRHSWKMPSKTALRSRRMEVLDCWKQRIKLWEGLRAMCLLLESAFKNLNTYIFIIAWYDIFCSSIHVWIKDWFLFKFQLHE